MTPLTIYQTVAAFGLTIAGETPQVFGVSSAALMVTAADLPARLISLSIGKDVQSIRALTTGANPQVAVSYTLNDLLLWQVVNLESPLRRDDTALLGYMQAWVDVFKANRTLAAGTTINNIQISAGIYPAGTAQYVGCEVVLSITENQVN